MKNWVRLVADIGYEETVFNHCKYFCKISDNRVLILYKHINNFEVFIYFSPECRNDSKIPLLFNYKNESQFIDPPEIYQGGNILLLYRDIEEYKKLVV